MKEKVVLKNGVQTNGSFLLCTMVVLNFLEPDILAELAKKCNDPSHELSPEVLQALIRCNLIEKNGKVPAKVREIVLVVVTIEGTDIILDDSPVLEPA